MLKFDILPILLPLHKGVLTLINLQMMNFFFPGSLSFLNTKTRIRDYRNTQIRIVVNETSTSRRYYLSIQYPQEQSVDYRFSKLKTNTMAWENTGYGEIELNRQEYLAQHNFTGKPNLITRKIQRTRFYR